MAPNLKKITLLVEEPSTLVDLPFLTAGVVSKNPPTPSTVTVDGLESSAASYWTWETEKASEKPSLSLDLFSADHLQSNLIQAAAQLRRNSEATVESSNDKAEADASCSSDNYWSERVLPSSSSTKAIDSFSQVPQHHPLNLERQDEPSAEDYWTDVRDHKAESDLYWAHSPSLSPPKASQDGIAFSDAYWDESSRAQCSHSDIYWSNHSSSSGLGNATVIVSADAEELARSRVRWNWSHPRSESDRYWTWETPTASVLLAGC
jgi:hypothetical protein